MELSLGEMLLIALAIVVLFGPDKLPEIARGLGEGVRKMKGAVEDIKTEIMKEADNPVSEIKKEIEKVKEAAKEANPINHLKEDLLSSNSSKNSVDNSSIEEKPILKPSEDENYEGPVSR